MEKPIGFSQLIKKYRKENKLTQVGLAKKLNRKQTTISNYEKGVHFPNNPEEIRAIAALLNQPASYILEAIEYSRSGTIEKHEALFIDLDKLSEDDLVKKYKFLVGGKEISGEELAKMLKLLEFERFNEKN